MVMAEQLGKFTKNYCIVHTKWVKFMVCKLHLSKIKKKKPNIQIYQLLLNYFSYLVW